MVQNHAFPARMHCHNDGEKRRLPSARVQHVAAPVQLIFAHVKLLTV
jgi:hypothetical protein